MAYQHPVIQEFEIRTIGALKTAPRGFVLECQTSAGLIGFWGDQRSMVNIEAIKAATPPFRVRAGCIVPRRSAEWGHVLWVPQSAPIEIQPATPGRG
jgi:hypothetical protein